MILILTHLITAVLLSSVLLGIHLIINQRANNNYDNNNEFECGFDSSETTRLPFSLRFFVLIVIFLVFDIEIVLLFPLILLMNISAVQEAILAGTSFMIILIGGLLHEWNQGTLSWVV